MLNKILKLNGVYQINKNTQKEVHGGILAECPTFFPLGCFAGAPFYCNFQGLPPCDPLDEES